MNFRPNLSKLVLLLLCTAGLLMLLPACSSDSDDDGPGGGAEDSAAPFVVSINPEDDSLISDLNSVFIVQFNEDMVQSSSAGNITFFPEISASISWINSLSLIITPNNLPEATEITVTIGTGLTDISGNSMAAPFTATFTTIARQLALMEMSPAPGSADINRNTNIILSFTEPVGGLLTGVTISDGNKVDYGFLVSDDGKGNHTLNPSDILPESIEFTVTIGTQVLGAFTGTSLATAESFTFTTGLDLDNTPPGIANIVPASGSNLPVDQGTLTIEFDEPVNLASFKLTSMNGQFVWASLEAGIEPELSPDGTMLTVYLPAVMPAGLNLQWVLADYEDQYGNIQTAETAWSATVAGIATPLYLKDGDRYTLNGVWEEGEIGSTVPTFSNDNNVQFFELGARNGANQWELREYNWQYSALEYYDILSVTSAGISLIGIADDEGTGFQEFIISNPLMYLELPFLASNTWTSTGSITLPDGTLNASVDGQVVDQSDLVLGEIDGALVTWTGVWKVDRDVTLSSSGQIIGTEMVQQWVVPGIGIVREIFYEQSFVSGDSGWTSSDAWRDLDGVVRTIR